MSSKVPLLGQPSWRSCWELRTNISWQKWKEKDFLSRQKLGDQSDFTWNPKFKMSILAKNMVQPWAGPGFPWWMYYGDVLKRQGMSCAMSVVAGRLWKLQKHTKTYQIQVAVLSNCVWTKHRKYQCLKNKKTLFDAQFFWYLHVFWHVVNVQIGCK